MLTHVAERWSGGEGSPDAQFLQRLKEHDSAAWSDLYDAHYNAVWRYVLARTGSPDTADDVAAQVFVEALEAIRRFQLREKPILAWLYTIARNQAGKWVRSRRREAGPPDPETPAEESGVIDEALILAEALERLTKDQREVIILRFYTGHSTSEIASLLGKNERAIYSTQARALASLRRYLSDEHKKFGEQADELWPPAGIERVEGR